jgi:diamine N-acetyltransferase
MASEETVRVEEIVSKVSLREITDENREAVVALRIAESQEGVVSSVADSLLEAEETPEGNPWYRAVYADDEAIGFVMLSWDVTPAPPRIIGPWFLWKLLIDERHQGRGYGREAVKLVADIARDHGATELLTTYVVGDNNPQPFYTHIGFVPTGEEDEKGERILALSLRAES